MEIHVLRAAVGDSRARVPPEEHHADEVDAEVGDGGAEEVVRVLRVLLDHGVQRLDGERECDEEEEARVGEPGEDLHSRIPVV